MSFLHPFLSRAEKDAVARAIADAERATSGEIHVHIAPDFIAHEPLSFARDLFYRLGLDRTRRRNGVLIAIAYRDHRFAIYGDAGIHAKAGQACWERAAKTLSEHFKQGRRGEGIAACVRLAGEELARHFPPEAGEPDELPNEISES